MQNTKTDERFQLKVQIEYYALIEKAPVIDFLKDDSA